RLHLHGRHGHTASLVFRVFVTFVVALVLVIQLPSSDTRLGPMPATSVPAGSPTTFRDRKSTRLNSSHVSMSYAVFCLKKNNTYEHSAADDDQLAAVAVGEHTPERRMRQGE